MRWWYFYWIAMDGTTVSGSQCLPMRGEFNLLEAHRWIEATHNLIGVITFFYPVSETQALQFGEYTNEINSRKKVNALPAKGGLRFIRGEKDEHPKPEDEPPPSCPA